MGTTMMSTTFLSSKTSAMRGLPLLRASGARSPLRSNTTMVFSTKTKKAASKKAADNSGNWTLKRTIAEKKPADIVQNFGDGVQFGGFTKANELFSGRLAMLGFAALIVQDFLTGQGAIAQIDNELGLQLWETEDLLLLQIGVIGALAFTGFASGGQPFRGLLEQLGFELGASSLHFEEDFFLASAAFFAVSAVFPAALAGLSSLSGFKSDK